MRTGLGRSAGLAAWLALAAACTSSTVITPDDGPQPMADAGPPPAVPVAVDTLAPEAVRAGQPIAIDCLLLDMDGTPFSAVDGVRSTIEVLPAGSVATDDEGRLIATRVGTLSARCTFASLRLTDDTPATIEVGPGEAAVVETALDRITIVAGESVTASCAAADAFGNPVSGIAPSLRVDPESESTTLDGLTASFTRSGRYEVACELNGAARRGVTIEVRPALPASLQVAVVPAQERYAIGQVISLSRVVADRFGNPVLDAAVPVVSDPTGESLGTGRQRFAADGVYALTATVVGPTEDDVVLSETVEVLVDGDGPAIRCVFPADGGIVEQAPGPPLRFEGTVADVSGVDEVTVDGELVPVAADGSFGADLTPAFGINFVDVAAVDEGGQERSVTCAYLLSDRWAPGEDVRDDTITLSLRQEAIDDADTTDDLDSLNDLLAGALESDGLLQTVDAELSASNPLLDECVFNTFFGCLIRARIDYLAADLAGPATSELTLVQDGLRIRVRLEDVRLQLRVGGTLSSTGWATVDSLEVEATFDAALAGGAPQVSLRPGSTAVTVGRLTTDFTGFSGFLIDEIIVPLARGLFRDTVSDLVEGFVVNELDSVLDGVLGGLDVSSLGASFEVARLGEGDRVVLAFDIGLTHLDASPERLRFGVGTRLTAPPSIGAPTRGVPVRFAEPLTEIDGGGTVAAAVDESVLNQALHALWRAGFLDATIDGATLGEGFPEGVEATIATGLTPVAVLRDDDRVELSLGAMDVDLAFPGLFADPIAFRIGARASVAAEVDGEDLSFTGFRLDELALSAPDVSLDMATRETLEGFLAELLEALVGTALNEALPAIPIPSFGLPPELSEFGLPGNETLGLVNPTLEQAPPHFEVRGAFAIQ